MDSKTFEDDQGRGWEVRLITEGRTSDYLNKKVHSPILEFSRDDGTGARRYASLRPGEPRTLKDMDPDTMTAVFGRARAH